MPNLIEGMPLHQQRLYGRIVCLSGHIEGSIHGLYSNAQNENIYIYIFLIAKDNDLVR